MGLYPNDLPKATLAQKADSVLDALRHRSGKGTGTGNRVIQICELVRRLANQVTNPGESGYDELVQALKDVNEWWLILEILGSSLFNSPYLERFERSLLDSVLPNKAAAQSHGRDTQFELFVAAIPVGSAARLVYWARWADATGDYGQFSEPCVTRIEGGTSSRPALPYGRSIGNVENKEVFVRTPITACCRTIWKAMMMMWRRRSANWKPRSRPHACWMRRDRPLRAH